VRSLGYTGLRAFVCAALPIGFALIPTWGFAGEPPGTGVDDDAPADDAGADDAPADAVALPDVTDEPEDIDTVPAATTNAYPITRQFTDLGTIRYVDPDDRRELWLGVDVGGAYVPEQLGLFDRTLWTVRFEPAYAVALTDYLAFGGRHGLVWYDAENIRARYHHHELEISGRPTEAAKSSLDLSDRLAFGFEHHNLRLADLEGDKFKLGGVLDYVLRLGYGMRHHITGRVDIDWNVQGRYVWLFEDTQRQVRASLRLMGRPGRKRGHQLGLELTGFIIHRDERQFGNELERVSPEGQIAATYEWMSPRGLGLFSKLRFTSALFSGEAPVYEVREEALNNVYIEASLGFRWAWH